MANLTSRAQSLANEMRKSKATQTNFKIGFTPIFEKEATPKKRWNKFLGEHTIMSHSQIGWKCKATGKITLI